MKLVSGSRPFGWPSPLALDILAALSLTLLGFLVFVPELVLGLKVVDGDLYRQVIPTTAWYKAAISSDRESFWTSGMLGGFPIAFTQYGLLSPLDWAASKVLDPDRAFALTLALHLPLAGIATYCYARVTGLSRLPSLLAGVGYQFSTEALALGLSGYILRSLFLLPTLLLSVELVARRGFRWAILAAVAVGAALISGTAYIVAIAMLNGGIYTVACGFCMWRKGAREQALRLLVAVGCAVSLGVGLAAIRVLPTLSVTAESVRSNGLAFDVAAAGSPSLGTVVAAYLLPLTRLEGVGDGVAPSYVGPIVLTLAMVAALGARRNFLRGVLVGLLLFNLLASLGRNGLLFGVLHQLPLFNAFRNVSRFSVFSAFFLSMLAAQLLEDSRGPLAFRGRTRLGIKVAAFLTTVGFGVVILAGCLWLYGGDAGSWLRAIMEEHNLGPLNPLRPRLFLALAAIPATLWLFHAFLTGRVSRAAFQFCSLGGTALLLLTVGLAMMQFRALDPTSPATARFLQGDSTLFHLMSYAPTISYYHYMSYLSQGNPNPVRPESPLGQDFRYRYMREALAPNFPLEFGLEAIDGYEVLQSTRQAIAMTYLGSDKAEEIDVDHIALQDTRELEARLGRIGGLSMLDRMRVFRAFNVKYLLTNLQLWQNTNELRLAFTSPIPMLNPRT
ncbi:MAG TPA: hypothetical protein VHS28_04835, partial [Chloroflexota bacterium]|nr:hypothetical protein [Chloroflexota bacterium]